MVAEELADDVFEALAVSVVEVYHVTDDFFDDRISGNRA
jgi:hypothetical protein